MQSILRLVRIVLLKATTSTVYLEHKLMTAADIDAAFKALSVGNVQKLPELRPNGSHAHPHRPPQGVQSQEQATITKLEKELEKGTPNDDIFGSTRYR